MAGVIGLTKKSRSLFKLSRSMYRGARHFLYSRGMVLAKMLSGLSLARQAQYDYVRASSLELVGREINERKVEGAVAELGVFQGEFAQLLNLTFSSRPLYLFDTFEGFNAADLALDRDRNYAEPPKAVFEDTSVENVLSIMPFRGRCIVKKGWFPDSAEDCKDERFCFVSLDADLYDPIYEGLQFFWPRLAEGGYIFVHDYTNDEYRGAKEAVRQFCAEHAIAYTPLPDPGGTAVIAKSRRLLTNKV